MADEPLKIYENESAVSAPLEARPPATYTFEMELRGNAFLSTIYVDDIDGATITAVFKDFNPLTSALYTIASHPPITTNGYHRKFFAEATHGVTILEITVAGGSPNFGAFTAANTLVGNFASPDSVQEVTGTVTVDDGAGVGDVLEVSTTVTVGPEAAVLTALVPMGETWRLRYAELVCRGFGRWRMMLDGVRLAGGVTDAGHQHDRVDLPPGTDALAGQTIEMRYTYNHGPAGIDLDAFVGITVV